MSEPKLPLLTRIWFCLVCLLRVLLDSRFAARVWAVRTAMPALPAAPPERDHDAEADEATASPRATARKGASAKRKAAGPKREAAAAARQAAPAAEPVAPLQLLALLQREGRLIDFTEQDIAGFEDADVGAAARVVHEGCRRVLKAHVELEPVRDEPEDSRVEVAPGFDPSEVKLTGNVSGKPPYRGVLRHRGWRVRRLTLPEPLSGHDFQVIAPAEVEL